MRICNPANDRHRRDLAGASENVAIVLFNQGRVAEALAAFEEHLPARRAVGESQSDRHSLPGRPGQVPQQPWLPANAGAATRGALKSLDEARGVLEELSAANPTAIDLRRQLAKCLHDYGYQLSELDRIGEGLQIHEKAKRVRELLVQSQPTVSRYRNDLGWTLANIGDMHMRSGRPAQAATALRRAIETLSEVPDPGPDDHFALAEFHALLGTVAGRQGFNLPSTPETSPATP